MGPVSFVYIREEEKTTKGAKEMKRAVQSEGKRRRGKRAALALGVLFGLLCAAQALAQDEAQEELNRIGPPEPILTVPEAGGELSGMLSCAQPLAGCVDADYPQGNTTLERLEDGERFLYTRAWRADEDGEMNPVYASYGKETLEASGTTGVETLTKMRKSDGKVLEQITIQVEIFEVTITFADEDGSIRYAFPFDGWEYHQPQVTAEGECRMDTTRLDALAGELAGYEVTDTWG